MSIAMNAEERRWRAEDDARTLAQAEAIKQDEPRLTAAKDAASRMAQEEQDRYGCGCVGQLCRCSYNR